MSGGRKIKLPGFKLDRRGRVTRDQRKLSVSKRLQVQSNRKVRVAKGTANHGTRNPT